MEAKFCSACGQPLNSQVKCEACGHQEGEGRLHPNAVAFFCYAFPVLAPILFLHWTPYSQSKQTRFHAWQAIILQVAALVGYFTAFSGMSFFSMGLAATGDPLVVMDFQRFFYLVPMFCMGLFVAYLFLMLILCVASLRGKNIRLPLLGLLAERRAGK